MSLKIVQSMTKGNLVFLQGANARIDTLVRLRINDEQCEQTGNLQPGYTVKIQLDRELTHMSPPRAEQIDVTFDGEQWNCIYCVVDNRVGHFHDQHRYYLEECPAGISRAILVAWERTRERTALHTLCRMRPTDFPTDETEATADELALMRQVANDVQDLAEQEEGAIE